jgi:geranylgeranyl reductase family protein
VRDAVVIGGGPAGSIAAATLAERGFDVALVEEHLEIGSPVHCTGLLGNDAFDEFDLPRDLVLGRATSARFWGAAGQSVLVRSDRIHASVVDRAALDRTLAARAEARGVTVHRGYRAERMAVERDRVRVEGPGGTAPIEARAVVLACGANYRFHKQLGLGVPSVFLQSAQLETPFPEVPDIEVQFGREIAPAGFAWLVPLQRNGAFRARIGLMSQTRSRERFAGFVSALCARAGADPAGLPAPRLKMLPLGPIRRTYGDRVLAVGDAAGLVKPTTGGGIYYGLLSGAVAGGVLADALGRDRLHASALQRYEKLWRRRLGQEIRAGLAFRRIAARLNDESIDALIELSRVNGVVPLLQQTASFNWHRKAAMALLTHPGVRKIVFQTWRTGVENT